MFIFKTQRLPWVYTPQNFWIPYCRTYLSNENETGAPSDVYLRAETSSNNYGSSHQPKACAFILKEIFSLHIISLNYGLGIFIVGATRSRNSASGSSLFRRVSKEPFLLNLPEKQLLGEFLKAELIPTTEIGI